MSYTLAANGVRANVNPCDVAHVCHKFHVSPWDYTHFERWGVGQVVNSEGFSKRLNERRNYRQALEAVLALRTRRAS